MTTANKLTITAHKANVRMKFEDTNSDEENAAVKQLFSTIVENAPDVDFTLRGNMRTQRMKTEQLVNRVRFVLYNDSKSRHFSITIEE